MCFDFELRRGGEDWKELAHREEKKVGLFGPPQRRGRRKSELLK